jgi:putative FmdB family regulatory protein
MPLYEYQCNQCGRRFEKIQRFSDPPVAECPQCAGTSVERLISSPAIQFKGSGWYVTDYARSGSSDSKKDEAKPAASDPGSSKSSADTSSSSTPAPAKAATDTK